MTEKPEKHIDAAWLESLRENPFTSHNIDLGGGYTTMHVEGRPFLSELSIVTAMKTFLQLAGLWERREALRLLDLGCLEGGFALEFAQAGFGEVVGLEARKVNYDNCRRIARHFGLSNLRFLHEDVKALAVATHGHFDVTLFLGLLYHLDNPVDVIRRLSEVAGSSGVLIVDTHFSPRNDREMGEIFNAWRYEKSALETVNDRGRAYEGRWWWEYEEGVPEEKQHPWDAVSNARSFVLTYPSLTRALKDAGFDHIYRLPFGDVHWEAAEGANNFRAWLVCFKEGLLDADERG